MYPVPQTYFKAGLLDPYHLWILGVMASSVVIWHITEAQIRVVWRTHLVRELCLSFNLNILVVLYVFFLTYAVIFPEVIKNTNF